MTTTSGDPPLDNPTRTWLGPGDPYTTNDDRGRVAAAIDGLTWHVHDANLLVPTMAAHAIAQAVRQLAIPGVTHVAFDAVLDYPDGSETATYAVYGIESIYPRQGRARLYVLDTGAQLLPLAHDVWPRATAPAGAPA